MSAKKKNETVPASKTLEKMQLELRDTIEHVCARPGQKVVEVVAFGSRHDDLRMLFRVHDESRWLKVLAAYLSREEGEGWYSFWGKKYMVKEGRLLYGWSCVIAADRLDEAIQQVRRLLTEADDEVNGGTRSTVTTVPLPSNLGYSERQQAQVRHKRDSQ